jgi:O-succinylbenzoic acid--CoA ligase
MLVEAWLKRAAASHPDRVAIETVEEQCTYRELLERARAGARELAALGVVPGERVAIALSPGLAFAEALHACMLHGAVAVPLDLRLAEPERAQIASSCALTIDRPLAAQTRALTVDRPPDARPEAHASEGELLHDLDAVAVVVHSSGTTDTPKPVELTYGNLLWSALGSAVLLELDPGERWLCTLPVAHVGGLSIIVRSAIYGTTAIVHERFDTELALDVLQNGQATLVSLVATTLERLLAAGLREPPSLRCALTGGGPVPAGLLERARAAGVPVAATYGLTEASSQVSTVPVALLAGPGPEASTTPDAAASAPLFCTRVRIAADGEILIAGPTVAPAALGPDGWLHSGDIGALDERGHLRVTGRRSDMIVTGGENVAPVEVEAALEAHPAVLEAAVLGRADPEWGEAVTAIVVVRPGLAAGPEELRAHCARLLAPFKVPKHFLLTSDPLPRTRSGKLSRRDLASWREPSGERV